MSYRPPSNRDIGLPTKLNAEKARHLGIDAIYHPQLNDYDRFVYFKRRGLNKTAMAKLFDVNNSTMAKWWQQFEEEQRNSARIG